MTDFWSVNTVQVETYRGDSGARRGFAESVEVACWIEEGATLVRDADGNEVVSSTRVYADLALADTFTPGSRVELPGAGPDRKATVITCARFDSGALDLGLDHLEVALS